MEIIRVDLNKDYSTAIAEAVAVLSSGGTVVYPTDTLYGLGANALDEKAAEKIFKIKNRSFSKPLPIIIKNAEKAKPIGTTNMASLFVLLERLVAMDSKSRAIIGLLMTIKGTI